MFEQVRSLVLRLAQVPAEPQPPSGAPESIKVFRAGRNYYYLRLLRWAVGQLGAVIGILFSFAFLHHLDGQVRTRQAARAIHGVQSTARLPETSLPTRSTPTATSADNPTGTVTSATPLNSKSAKSPGSSRRERRTRPDEMVDLVATQIAAHAPWAMGLIYLIEFGALLFFLLQIPLTYAAVRLWFEQHWYIVTDRSLRIRTGIFQLQESTMSFANLQQVEVQQGPLQRLLGLADVRVQSAGGGNSHKEPGHRGDSLHTGVFHSVDNAQEIRDLILERLRRFRETGLGDPGESSVAPTPLHPSDSETAESAAALAAARDILAETRALRRTWGA